MTSPDTQVLDAVVIGGGLAGVRTALGLHDSGRSFVLLEANERLGGRVKTIRDPELPGGAFDVGARQIGQGYRRTWDLIARFGLNTVDEAVQALPMTYLIGGEFIAPGAWPTSLRNPFPEPFRSLPLPLQGPSFLSRHDPFTTLDDWRGSDALALDAPVSDRLRADGFDDEAIRLVQLSLGGIDPSRTSLLTLLQEHHRLLDEIRLTSGGSMAIEQVASTRGNEPTTPVPRRAIQNIVGGTGALIEAMASSFTASVRCGHVVTAIDIHDSLAVVSCANGVAFRARHVVCAAPFTAVRSIAVTPPLPATQQAAVATMGYTHNTRVWAHVTRRFWDDDGLPPSTFSDAPFRAAYALRDPATDDHTMMFLMSGSAAAEMNSGTGSIAERVLDAFTQARPSAAGALTPFLTSSWASEPHIGGLRHSYAPGQMTEWLASVDRPHLGLLHFAGEHTRRQEMGMEAALESAERVLTELGVA